MIHGDIPKGIFQKICLRLVRDCSKRAKPKFVNFNSLRFLFRKMIDDFKNIDYLNSGTERPKLAFDEIKKYRILEILGKYNPILTGTIPIGIDLPESDLDIICECKSHTEFTTCLSQEFSGYEDFKVYTKEHYGIESTIAEFETEHFTIEIFGENIPTEKQNAYRHMVIEFRILNEKGTEFR